MTMTATYLVDVCSKCSEEAEYHPNPHYIFEHDKCGFSGHRSDLITAVDKTRICKEISHLEGLLKRFPNVVDGKLVKG